MLNKKSLKLERRKNRIRAKISGTAEKPRLNVHRSLTNIFAQLIDDVAGKTLVSVHSKKIKPGEAKEYKGKTALAYLVGKEIATQAKAKGITKIVFDRAGNKYHGRIAALAEGARENGLIF
ncbi:MAG TPA: 50S ribosomal protein L18 [Candidatus Magasanikbacteria bacterium]|jgi:large subunit ribosomal protein L18|nr:50S ribosomal protein L18 [Candidatus Magasanikbacteria bacterium]HQF57099.1 50S ribosomal protein L18 [Candidatus Magasanikbacteria bacterium]HQL52877.1 50S ribosomal protein L18 [Candidatus Magasanikbacteria bacterium]